MLLMNSRRAGPNLPHVIANAERTMQWNIVFRTVRVVCNIEQVMRYNAERSAFRLVSRSGRLWTRGRQIFN